MVFDFARNPETGDLLIQKDDFVFAQSDNVHAYDIIVSSKGDYKNAPLLGVSLFSYYFANTSVQALESEIRLQLKADGYKVKYAKVIDNKTIDINGEY